MVNQITKIYLKRLIHPRETWTLIKYQSIMSTRFEELLINATYKWLSDRLKPDTTVLDIGAFVLDTAMYFALFKEATQVLAYEPDKKAYEIAEKHMKAYGIRNSRSGQALNKIKLFRYAIGSDHLMEGGVQIPKDHEGVTVLGLNQIIPVKSKRVVIKCDCEGGEYDIFTPDANLSKVYAIQIEYHDGPKKIPNVLKSKGFKVLVEAEQKSSMGYIYAERR